MTDLVVPVRGDPGGRRRNERGPRPPRATSSPRRSPAPNADPCSSAATTAENIDYFDGVTDPAPIVFAFVLGLTLVLLTVAFRSLVVAVTAIALNLLSVGAAYGLLVLVFQHGCGADLLGFKKVDVIEAWVPLFLFSVFFGLSMDYQVFLLSRIRERYDRDAATRTTPFAGVSRRRRGSSPAPR